MRSVLAASGDDRDPGLVGLLQAIGQAFGITPGDKEIAPIGVVYGERVYTSDHVQSTIAGVRLAAGSNTDPAWDNAIGALLVALGLQDPPAEARRRPAAVASSPAIDTYRVDGAGAADLVAKLGRYGFRAELQPAEGGGACLLLAGVGDRAEWADRIIGQWAEAAGATVQGQGEGQAGRPARRRREK